MSKHKHYDVIIEWASDNTKKVQMYDNGEWHDLFCTPSWDEGYEYRIKPERQPDIVTECKVLGPFKSILWNSTRGTVPGANLRLTFDGETGELKWATCLTGGQA